MFFFFFLRMKIQNMILNILKIVINMSVFDSSNYELDAHKSEKNLIYALILNGHFFPLNFP